MTLKVVFEKIRTRPVLRILVALGLAGIFFLIINSVWDMGGLISSPEDVAVSEEMILEEMSGKMLPRRPGVQPTPPRILVSPFYSLIKPALYIIFFLIIYLLFLKPREPQEEGVKTFLFVALVVVLLVFVFSSADLLRMVLDYYLQERPYMKTSYLYEKFARGLSRRMAALLLVMPICTFLNLKASGKGSEVKGFFLALFSLTGVFSLILAYWLLNGLFVWGLGVKGVELRAYTFPLAYFSILFPLNLFYLVQYLKR